MEPNTTLTVDAGDWFSGSLMHLISISKYYNEFGAIELKFLTDCKYDATTFGNHEFDPTERGIYHLLHKSQNKYYTPLPVVLSNIHYMDECAQFNNLTREGDAKYAPPRATITVDKSGSPSESPYITPFVLKELTDSRGKTLKVGIMGMFGPNAAQLSVAYRKCLLFDGFKQKRRNKLQWRKYVKKTINVANELREKHGAQVVIMLAHSGEPEDVRLMDALKKRSKNKPIVDIHISSHTHHIYLVNRSVGKGKTYIHQAGPFGTNLGVLQFEYDFNDGVISKLLVSL
jgi:2',3'-cyclic-nucleotide 2'-phosphodiesterase (5'-nucleotidase family)